VVAGLLLVALCAVGALSRSATPAAQPAAAATAQTARIPLLQASSGPAAPATSDPIPTLFPTTPRCTAPAGLPSCPGSPTTSAPTTSPTPTCTGEDCIPQPVTTPPSTGTGVGQGTGDGSSCSVWDPSTWLSCLFQPIVTDAINPLLSLLASTLLTTPTPDSVPAIGQLWTNSWDIMVASYSLLVLIAGIVVMAYGTMQQRHTIREILP
jgi:hypothetical protein